MSIWFLRKKKMNQAAECKPAPERNLNDVFKKQLSIRNWNVFLLPFLKRQRQECHFWKNGGWKKILINFFMPFLRKQMPTKNGNALGMLFIAIKKKQRLVGNWNTLFMPFFLRLLIKKVECFSSFVFGRPVLLRLFQKFVPAWGCG